MMLLAAMIRARLSGRAAQLHQRIQRDDEEAAEHPEQQQIGQHPPDAGLAEQRAERQFAIHRWQQGRGIGQIEPEEGQPDRPQRHQPDLDVARRQPLAEQRPGADADGEGSQQQGDRRLAAAQHILAVGRYLGEEQRAVEPEPGDAEDGQEDGAVLAREADVAPGFGQRIDVDHKVRRRRRRIRNAATGNVTGHRDAQPGQGDPHRIDAGPGEQAAGQRADQDGDEGAGLDLGVAADQFPFIQVLRQDRVLDRPEQRRLQAEQKQGGQQQGQAVQQEAGDRDQHDPHFEQLGEPRQHRLVVLVGELPGGRRKEEERQDEQAGGEVGEDFRAHRRPLRRLEGDQHDQRVLVEIVVERAEKLGQKQRAETPCA